MKTPTCTDCKTEMEPGFIPEMSAGAAWLQTLWHPGQPDSKTVFGLKTGAVKVDSSAAVPIIAFRCAMCHQLKLVASN